ncbi:DUF3300 domain-containing protein [Colwelliaceae bacterium MEBiC 14330]
MNSYKTSWHNKTKKITVLLTFVIISLTLGTIKFAKAEKNETIQELVISEAELVQTLAPIALYPDTLLTHILIATTYPLEVIEAERWLQKNSTWTAKKLQRQSQKKEWDASIKALLAFPKLLTQLSEDLFWMRKLGDAFLQDEARVLASIQMLRRQADQSGALATMDNVTIIKEANIIIIEPAQPEVIYVPYYDTRVVYGHWSWSHYPPVYWHRPYHYVSAQRYFFWGHGRHISNYFFFNAFQWHKRYIVRSHHHRPYYHSRKKIVVSHHAKRWQHQPKHRRGVIYSTGYLNKKYKKSTSRTPIRKIVQHRPSQVSKVKSVTKITSANLAKLPNKKLLKHDKSNAYVRKNNSIKRKIKHKNKY